MITPLQRIAEALDALASAGGERAPEALSPGELVAVTAAFGALRRHVEAAFAPVAAEVARQSRAELGRDSLAKRQGFRTPVAMIATATGATGGEAARLLQVGTATAPRRSLTGELLPAAHPHVAAAVAAGSVDTWAASQIIGLLDRLALRVDADRRDVAERQLVDLAPGLRPDELARVIARAAAHLDPDGVEPHEHELRDERSLVIQERDGITVLTARLDPETAAPVRAAIDGIVTGALRRNEHRDEAERDQRSVRQLRADALADVCRHGLGCDALPTAPSATVVVRIALDALTSGEGVATIDGIDTPVSAQTARRIPPTPSSSPAYWAEGPRSSTGEGPSASSPALRSSLSANATAAAPRAGPPPRGRTCTTSDGGSAIAGRPTSRTASCCARGATTASTMTAGKSSSRERSRPPRCGSSRRPGSTPTARRAAEVARATSSWRELSAAGAAVSIDAAT